MGYVIAVAGVVVVLVGVAWWLVRRRRGGGADHGVPVAADEPPMTDLESALDRATDRTGRPLSDRLADEHVEDLRIPDDTGPLLRRALDHVEHHDAPIDDFRIPDDTGPVLRRALDHVEPADPGSPEPGGDTPDAN